MTEQVRALFISDVHLGSKGAHPELLLETLRKYHPQYLFIVGDFIDGWLLQKRIFWTQENSNVIRKILSYSKDNTKIVYLTGNHDEFLRVYGELHLGNIEIRENYVYENFFIVHGDTYDGVVKLKYLAHIGAWGYEFAMFVDRTLKKLGMKRSLSKLLKNKVKDAVKFITNFETELARQSSNRNCRGVICGHIHKTEDKMIDDVRYMNCGDWVENFSYIVHTMDGHYQVRHHGE